MGYYLADGIYPSWANFVKSISQPMGNKKKYFAKAQEAARKDVERAFGVLQSRFAIVRGPSSVWDTETLENIMKACVVMHNMIIEDEEPLIPMSASSMVDKMWNLLMRVIEPSMNLLIHIKGSETTKPITS